MKKIVAYYRSTNQESFVLSDQKKAVAGFAAKARGEVVAGYTENEKRRPVPRTALAKAIETARAVKGTLVIAKLDTLSRNFAFMSALRESRVKFLACDNPHVNPKTIDTLVALAETESQAASQKIKSGLAAVKAEGKLLGSARPGHWKGREHLRGWKKGAANSAKVRSKRIMNAYAFLLPKMRKMEAEMSYDQIAKRLNDDGHVTSYGKPFTATSVWRLLKRAEKMKIA